MQPPLSNALLEQDCRRSPLARAHSRIASHCGDAAVAFDGTQRKTGPRAVCWVQTPVVTGSSIPQRFAGFQGAKTPARFKLFSPLKAA